MRNSRFLFFLLSFLIASTIPGFSQYDGNDDDKDSAFTITAKGGIIGDPIIYECLNHLWNSFYFFEVEMYNLSENPLTCPLVVQVTFSNDNSTPLIVYSTFEFECNLVSMCHCENLEKCIGTAAFPVPENYLEHFCAEDVDEVEVNISAQLFYACPDDIYLPVNTQQTDCEGLFPCESSVEPLTWQSCVSCNYEPLPDPDEMASQERSDSKITQAIQLFPCPAFNKIEVSGIEKSNTKILRIINALGKEIDLNFEANDHVLDISILQSGVYYIILDSKGERVVKSFIKG